MRRSCPSAATGLECIDLWPVDREPPSTAISAGRIALPHRNRTQRGAGHPGYFARIRAACIVIDRDTGVADIVVDDRRIVISIVDDRRVPDNSSTVDDRNVLLFADVVIVDMGAGHV